MRSFDQGSAAGCACESCAGEDGEEEIGCDEGAGAKGGENEYGEEDFEREGR